jgi:putative DNA primase/helicase
MITVNRACDYWSNGGYCGSPEVRRYINGWRCIAHTPARVAGRPDIQPDPELTLAALRAKAGARYAADHSCGGESSGFDAKHARDFLDALFGPINTGRIGVTAIGNGPIRNAHFQQVHEAVHQAEAWDRLKPVGIYFRVTMLPPEGVIKGRGGAEDSHAINCMWADLDYGTIGHKPPANGPRLPADADEALTLIEGLPEVSILINSGGGLYPLWMFNEPVYLTDDNRPKFAQMAEAWQHRINKRAGRRNLHYGVGVGNLDRLLRLPGTINRKAELERPCRVVHTTGKVHALWG